MCVHDILGLVFLPAFIPPSEQRRLVRWALCEQARHPNETNLDSHYVLPHEGVWNQCTKSWSGKGDDMEVFPRATPQRTDAVPDEVTGTETPGPRKLISNEPASTANYVELASTPKPPAPPSQTLHPVAISSLIPRLRWANVGWYYHWGTKQYDFTRGPGEIAPLVRNLCKGVVESIPWERVFGDSEGQAGGRGGGDWGEDGPDWMDWKETYGRTGLLSRAFQTDVHDIEPDAGIVNFYQTKVGRARSPLELMH